MIQKNDNFEDSELSNPCQKINENQPQLINYKSFDIKKVLDEFEIYFEKYSSLIDIHKELLYLSYRIQLPEKYLNNIIEYLKDKNQDQNQIVIQRTYCLILRQSIIKGARIRIDTIIEIFNVIKDKISQTELVEILSIKQQQEFIKEEDFDKILNNNELDIEIKQNLIKMKFNNKDYFCNQDYVSNISIEKMNQMMVTKNVHIEYQRNFIIEENQDQNYDCIYEFINENQVSKNIIQIEQKEKQKRKVSGTLFIGTYITIKQLYEYAITSNQIKEKYKNELLPERLFGQKYFSKGQLGDFLCDRMIIETFLIISEKQSLNQKAIDKIFQLFNSFEEVKTIFMKDQSREIYINSIHISENITEDLNDIEQLTKRIYKVFSLYDKSHSKISLNHSFLGKQLTCFGDKNQEVIDKIEEIMFSEFQKIRVSALKIILNLASQQQYILNDQQKNLISELQNRNESNQEFRKVALQLYSLLNQNNQKQVIEGCINKIKNCQYEGIDYVLNHVEVRQIANLLQGKNISILIQNISNKQITKEYQIKLSEIVSIFLSHDNLNIQREDFNQIFNLLENNLDQLLKGYLLKSILLFLKKNPEIQDQVYKELIKNFSQFTDSQKDQIILSLGKILKTEQKEINIDQISDEFSSKLFDHKKIIPNSNGIDSKQIEEKNDSNYPSISLIVAKIIYNLISQSQFKLNLSKENISHLIWTLNHKDKQTQVYALKILNLFFKNLSNDQDYIEICDQLIEHLSQNLINDFNDTGQQIYYSFLLYTQLILLKQKKFGQIIELQYIEALAQIYCLDIDSEDKGYLIIQKNIMEILQNQTYNKSIIPVQFMNQFENILNNDHQMQKDVINILIEYTKYENLQQNLIKALQNELKKEEIQSDIKLILEQVIRRGQNISDRELQNYIDNISISEEDSIKCFEILDIARNNLILSEHIFTSLQLERARYVIQKQSDDYIHAVDYIYQKVQEGLHISSNIFQIIAQKLDQQQISDKLMKILLSATSNKQIIPKYVVDKLQTQLNTQNINQDLMLIFINMLKNNQEFSNELIICLENLLNNKNIPEKVLQFFAIPSQNCQLFSSKIIEQLCRHIQVTQDLNQEIYLLQAINTKIKANSLFHQNTQYIDLVNQVLIQKLSKQKERLIPLCVNIIDYFFQQKYNLNTEVQIKLKDLILDKQIKYENKMKISKTLKNFQLDEETDQFIKQFSLEENLKYENLCTSTKQIELIPENFKQINLILQDTRNSRVLLQVISLLENCSNKQEIPNEMIQNIVLLLSNKEVKDKCLNLIKQIIKSNQQFPQYIFSFLIDNYEEDLQKASFLTITLENQTLIDKLKNIQQLDQSKKQQNSDCSIHILKNTYNYVKEGFLLQNDKVQLLIQIADQSKDIEKVQECVKILSQSILMNQLKLDEDIVQRIERLIQHKDMQITTKIIKAYTKIIVQQKYQDLTNTVDSFLQRKIKEKQTSLQALHECVSYAYQFEQKLNRDWLKILEINLYNKSQRISNLSFRGLRCASRNGVKSDIFNEYCDQVIQVLEIFQKPIKSDLDLIDTLNYLQSYNLEETIKKTKNQSDWNLKLLEDGFILINEKCNKNKILNLIQQGEQNIDNHVEFLQTIIQLKDLTDSQIKDMMIFKKTIGEKETIKLLNENIIYQGGHTNKKNRWQKLQQGWLEQMLQKKISNKRSEIEIFIQIMFRNVEMIQKNNDICEKLAMVLNIIGEIDNISEFKNLLDFININEWKLINSKRQLSVQELRQQLEIKMIYDRFEQEKEEQLIETIKQLQIQGWTYQRQKEILDKVEQKRGDKKKMMGNLKQLFKSLYYYRINVESIDINNLIDQDDDNWSEQVLSFGLIRGAKDYNILESEFEQLNNDNRIKDIFKKIYENKEKEQWKYDDIRVWAVKVKKLKRERFNGDELIIESLAVIKQAIQIQFKQIVNYSQMMSALIILKDNDKKGVLLQVSTGEGKSLIIGIVAIYYGLQGLKINIHTSSFVLAERDCKYLKPLYEMFNLSCIQNRDRSKYIKGEKQCYRKDIVYGDVSQFQFDYLRHHHSQLNTMGNRNMQIAIIDEVDSMLIDESSKFARLSTKIVGIELLQPIYLLIWQRINILEQKIVFIDSKYYYFQYGKVNYTEKNKSLSIFGEDGKIIYEFGNLEQLVKIQEFSEIGQEIQNIDEFKEKHLVDYINNIIDKSKLIMLPTYFKQYVKLKLHSWIHSAILAMKYKEDIHYIICQGDIKPVDFQNTGVIQDYTYWGNGLHQFLQIKHNLEITSETLLTNFLSNVGYFKKYNGRLIGLTGTLGSKNTQDMLKEVYNVDLMLIPQNNYKLFHELPLLIVNQKKWLQQIINSSINECLNKRGVLIICETIQTARVIYNQLISKHAKIKLYDRNNNNQEKEIEKIQSGYIFVATNLAGRGTNINSNDIENYGGLHVILTFMPSNQRIEEQAFGRTARYGNLGTGQIILNEQHLKSLGYSLQDYQSLKIQRDQFEYQKLQEFKLNEINQKEEYFQQYCNLLDQLRSKINSSNELTQQEKFYSFSNIEERWALFLLELEDKNLQDNKPSFDEFRISVIQDVDNKQIITNPFHQIDILNHQVNKSLYSNNIQNSINKYKTFNTNNDQFATVYLEQAYLIIKSNINNKKNEALQLLQKGLDLITQEVALWQSIVSTLSETQTKFQNSNLNQQIIQKLNIIGTYANSIEANIKVIQKSKRLIDIVGIDIFQNLFFHKIQTFYIGLEKNEALEQCKKIGHQEFKLIFNDLSYSQDFFDLGQAKIIINQIYQDDKNIQFTFQLNQIPVSQLTKILQFKNTFQNLNKEGALQMLKQEQGGLFKRLISSSSILLKHAQQNYEKLSVQDAINKINQDIQSDNFDIDLIIIDSNFSQLQEEIKNKTHLDIELIELNKQTLIELLNIRFDSCNLIIISDIEDISKIVGLSFIKTINHLKKQNYISYSKEVAQNIFKFDNNEKHVQIIQIPLIPKNNIKEVLENCKDQAKFKLQLNSIETLEDLNIIDHNNIINARFRIKQYQYIEKLLDNFKHNQQEFQLILKHLNAEKIQKYINLAELKQQDIKIIKKQKFKEFFKIYKLTAQLELQEFEARGFKNVIVLSENKSFPFYNILILGTLVLSQCIVGGLLVATGLGSFIGGIILSEGVSDFISLIQACYKRELLWSDYCQQKAFSIILTIITLGFGGFKEVQFGRNFFKSQISEKGVKLVQINHIFHQTWRYTISELIYSLILKGGNLLATKIVSNLLRMVEPLIQCLLFDIVQQNFYKTDTIKLINKLYVLAQILNKQLINQIQPKIHEILTKNCLINCLTSCIASILPKSTILNDNLQSQNSIITYICRALKAGKSIFNQNQLISNLHQQFKLELKKMAKNDYNFQSILLQQCKKIPNLQKNEYIKTLSKILTPSEDEIDKITYIQITDEHEQEFKKQNIHPDLISFFKKLREQDENFTKSENKFIQNIITEITDQLTEQVLGILEQQIIAPWTNYGINLCTQNAQEKYFQYIFLEHNNNDENQIQQNNEQIEDNNSIQEQTDVDENNDQEDNDINLSDNNNKKQQQTITSTPIEQKNNHKENHTMAMQIPNSQIQKINETEQHQIKDIKNESDLMESPQQNEIQKPYEIVNPNNNVESEDDDSSCNKWLIRGGIGLGGLCIIILGGKFIKSFYKENLKINENERNLTSEQTSQASEDQLNEEQDQP